MVSIDKPVKPYRPKSEILDIFKFLKASLVLSNSLDDNTVLFRTRAVQSEIERHLFKNASAG